MLIRFLQDTWSQPEVVAKSEVVLLHHSCSLHNTERKHYLVFSTNMSSEDTNNWLVLLWFIEKRVHVISPTQRSGANFGSFGSWPHMAVASSVFEFAIIWYVEPFSVAPLRNPLPSSCCCFFYKSCICVQCQCEFLIATRGPYERFCSCFQVFVFSALVYSFVGITKCKSTVLWMHFFIFLRTGICQHMPMNETNSITEILVSFNTKLYYYD